MTQYPAAYISFRVYEDSVNEVGVANVTLPDITNKAVTIMGSGMMGDVSVPIMGMIENMTMSMKFLSHTDPKTFALFLEQRKHQIELKVAEEFWDIEDAEIGMWPNKYVMIARPKSMKSGSIAPATASDASGEFDVYLYAAYRDGTELWYIDKRNMIFHVNGKDYMADVRKALGYN